MPYAKSTPEISGSRSPEPSPNRTGLPDGLKAKMEGAFGTRLDHIRVNKNSAFPAKVGAIATTQGNRIDFAPGQYNPHSAQGQKLIGHEAWHTVQQAQGRVKPTLQMKTGHLVNDSEALEAEADRMGERAFLANPSSASVATPMNRTGYQIVQRAKKGIHVGSEPVVEMDDEKHPAVQVDQINLEEFNGRPDYWNDLQWVKVADKDYWVADLPRVNPKFQEIAGFLNLGIQEKPYTAPKKEKTRMVHAQNRLDDQDASDLVKDKARLRLKEGDKDGAARVKSGPIVVSKIEVIANLRLWQNYMQAKSDIKEELKAADEASPLKKVTWATKDRSNVLDEDAGEAQLLTGTSASNIDKIIDGGFRPDLSPNKAKPGAKNPKYGMLGQGTYFSDTMSKVMTYSACPECQDYNCDCEPQAESQVLYTRALLGRPKKMRGFLQPGGSLRTKDLDQNKAGRHSVYSKGLNVSKNLFSAGSGTNEFAIKKAAQMYPEFRIYWKHQREEKQD